MKDRVILASYLMSPLSKITNPENTTQFKLVKDSTSNRVKDLKQNNSIPITLHDNLLTIRDTDKVLRLEGDLLKMITIKKYNSDLASSQDRKLMYDFAKEMNFDFEAPVNKSTNTNLRDRTLINLLKSPSLMVSASGVSKTKILSSDLDELCDRLKLLIQKKQAGNKSDITNQEIVAVADKVLEYKCKSQKKHKQFLISCYLLHDQV